MIFPKSARLKSQRDFERVGREGARKRTGEIILVARKDKVQRIGIRISRRVGPAVARNRIKRVIREFFRLNRGLFPSGDILVIAMPGLARRTNSGIRLLLEEAARKFSKCQKE